MSSLEECPVSPGGHLSFKEDVFFSWGEQGPSESVWAVRGWARPSFCPASLVAPKAARNSGRWSQRGSGHDRSPLHGGPPPTKQVAARFCVLHPRQGKHCRHNQIPACGTEPSSAAKGAAHVSHTALYSGGFAKISQNIDSGGEGFNNKIHQPAAEVGAAR